MKRLCASLMFFTRLPLWRAVDVPSECFKHVVEFWPAVGWLTGGVTAALLYGFSFLLPAYTAVVLAFMGRMLLTGCLHEDGLADFCDGFGGGKSRQRILEIMKDSHIGTYGVAGLIFYFLLLTSSVAAVTLPTACFIVLAADCWSKFCASQIINILPYCRTVQEAKNRTVYDTTRFPMIVIGLIFGAMPALLLPASLLWCYMAPPITTILMIWLMRVKIKGYTGDCCGATFLIGELAFILVAAAIAG